MKTCRFWFFFLLGLSAPVELSPRLETPGKALSLVSVPLMLAMKRNAPKTVDANLYNHSKTHRIARQDAFINSLITACNKKWFARCAISRRFGILGNGAETKNLHLDPRRQQPAPQPKQHKPRVEPLANASSDKVTCYLEFWQSLELTNSSTYKHPLQDCAQNKLEHKQATESHIYLFIDMSLFLFIL